MVENIEQIKKENMTENSNEVDKNFLLICKSELSGYKINEKNIIQLFRDIKKEDCNLYGIQALQGLLGEGGSIDYITNEDIKNEIKYIKDKVTQKNNIQNNTENIQDNTENIQDNTETLKRKQIETKTQFLETKIAYNFLDKKIKPNLDELNTFTRTYLTVDIQNKLKEANLSIQDYMSFRYAAEQLIKQKIFTPDSISFITQFNALNTTLHIDYQIDLPTEQLQYTDKPQNLTDIIHTPTTVMSYPSIRAYTTAQPDIFTPDTDSQLNISPDLQQDIREHFSNKTKQTIKEQIQSTILQNQLATPQDFAYTESIDIQTLFRTPRNTEDTVKIQTIIDNVVDKYTQEYIITQTNQQIKKNIILQAITGLATYFDTTTTPTENFAQDFDLTQGDIDIQGDILHLHGKMHGQIVHFFYNLNTGELQANDYLYKAIGGDTYIINDINKGRTTLPTKLPTIQALREQIQKTNIKDIIQEQDSRGGYTAALSKKSTKIQDTYTNNTMNKSYITRMNERNLFVQGGLDLIANNLTTGSRSLTIGGKNINLDNSAQPITITRDIQPNEYALITLRDRTSHYYRSAEQLHRLRDLTKQLDRQIQTENIRDARHTDPVVNQLLSQSAMNQNDEKRNNPSEQTSFLTFFDLLTPPIHQAHGGIIDLQLFQTVITRIQKNESIVSDTDPRYFREKYNNIITANQEFLA